MAGHARVGHPILSELGQGARVIAGGFQKLSEIVVDHPITGRPLDRCAVDLDGVAESVGGQRRLKIRRSLSYFIMALQPGEVKPKWNGRKCKRKFMESSLLCR